MPTGYTAKLMEEGQTFPEFALLCARAMGACIVMRDDPLDKPIPERFEPTDYYTKRINEAKAELARLEEMGGTERIAFGERQREETVARRRRDLENERAQHARLADMSAQVRAWEPPTGDHVGLKDFMLNQISVSSQHGLTWAEKWLREAEAKPPVQYYAEAVAEATRTVGTGAVHQAEENQRTESRNAWLAALRASLA